MSKSHSLFLLCAVTATLAHISAVVGQVRSTETSARSAEARDRLRAGAEAGDVKSMVSLARELLAKESADERTEGIRWCTAASEIGDSEASYMLACQYLAGGKAPRHEAYAFRLARVAAEGGHTPARRLLGELYLDGKGTQPNVESAAACFEAAAEAGDVRSSYLLSKLIATKHPPGFDEAAELRYLRAAADRGDPDAAWDMAHRLRHGIGVPKDTDRAADYLVKLVTKRTVKAMDALSELMPSALARAAVRPRFLDDVFAPHQVDTCVKFDAVILEQADGKWQVTARGALGRPTRITVDAERFRESRAKPGHVVRLVGRIVDERTILGLIGELAPTDFRFSYKLRDPQGVVGGHYQTFHADGVVTNTGMQPIKSLKLSVRIYSKTGPNDIRQEVVVKDLKPGEKRSFSASAEFYNYQYIGDVSVPKVEVKEVEHSI